MNTPNRQIAWAYVRTASPEGDLEHQVTACRSRAEADGFTIPGARVYADRACSGATLLRPGFLGLLAAIHAGAGGVRLYVADLARLTRDLDHGESIYRHFDEYGVVLVPLA